MADTEEDKRLNRTTVAVGVTFETPYLEVPGIVTGAAYADLDALGVAFMFTVPKSGVIQSAIYYDLDDEGLQVDLWLLDDKPKTQTADNSALVLNDSDLRMFITRIQFTTFADANTGQVSNRENIGRAYVQANRRMWAQLQARGALNIAAGNLPAFKIQILADE